MLKKMYKATEWRSQDCGWRRRPPDMEGGCEYIEDTVAVSRKVVTLQRGGWVRG